MSRRNVMDGLGRLRIDFIRIRKVHRPNGNQRFDLFVLKNDVPIALKKLNRIHGWMAREDTLKRLRPRRAIRISKVCNIEKKKVASLNIAGLSGKVMDLQHLLNCRSPVFMLLQETNRTPGAWPIRLKGYHALEGKAKEEVQGSHGLLMALRKGLGLTLECIGEPQDFCVCCG